MGLFIADRDQVVLDPDEVSDAGVASQVIRMRSDAKYPAANGSLITGVVSAAPAGSGFLKFIGVSVDDSETVMPGGGAASASTPLPASTVPVPANPNRIAVIVLAQSELRSQGLDPSTTAEATFTIGGTAPSGRQPRTAGDSVGQGTYATSMTAHVKTGVTGANDVSWTNLVRTTNTGEIRSRRRVFTVFEVISS